MRKIGLVLFFLILVQVNFVFADNAAGRKGYSQIVFVNIGAAYWGKAQDNTTTAYTLGWQGWIVSSRVIGFYLDAQIWAGENESLFNLSYGISIQPFGRTLIEPYIWLGFLNGKTKAEEEYYAMPVTAGANLWFGQGAGIRVQLRFYPFSGQELFDASTGLFIKL